MHTGSWWKYCSCSKFYYSKFNNKISTKVNTISFVNIIFIYSKYKNTSQKIALNSELKVSVKFANLGYRKIFVPLFLITSLISNNISKIWSIWRIKLTYPGQGQYSGHLWPLHCSVYCLLVSLDWSEYHPSHYKRNGRYIVNFSFINNQLQFFNNEIMQSIL